MKINILLCDTFPGLLPDYIPSYVSMFTQLFDAVTDTAEYEVFPAYQGVLPDVLRKGELYLITGSNAGAYEKADWIRRLLGWIRMAHEKRVKLAGICFGHQAIAQALGGQVEKAPQGWGTGIRTSELLDKEALPYFPEGVMRLLYNHHDQVVRLPEVAKRVATSSFCVNDSFRIGNHILTFQGHPEYTSQYARHLITNHAPDEPLIVKTQALQSLDMLAHQGFTVARWLIEFAGGLSEGKV